MSEEKLLSFKVGTLSSVEIDHDVGFGKSDSIFETG